MIAFGEMPGPAEAGPAPPRNRTKGIVRYETLDDGRRVAVKDVSHHPAWFRWLWSRRRLRREERAYRRLEGVEGVVACLGRDGPDRLVLERFDGVPLPATPKALRSRDLAERIAAVVERIHARGVAIVDLHRSNVLVDSAGEVRIVDFAEARMSRPGRAGGLFLCALQQVDCIACLRIAAWITGEEAVLPSGAIGRIYRIVRRGLR